MGTIITVLILAVIVSLIVWKMVRDKKAGKKSCGCDCTNCSGCPDRKNPPAK